MTGGEIIRKLRIQKGYSLKELSEKVDVNYVFYQNLKETWISHQKIS
ncbi:MAG: helix-turn-helix transcriptional regulator [Treponema sp.]|nr:helix-turn-helix transcriptional regulator [Treponema sp.]